MRFPEPCVARASRARRCWSARRTVQRAWRDRRCRARSEAYRARERRCENSTLIGSGPPRRERSAIDSHQPRPRSRVNSTPSLRVRIIRSTVPPTTDSPAEGRALRSRARGSRAAWRRRGVPTLRRTGTSSSADEGAVGRGPASAGAPDESLRGSRAVLALGARSVVAEVRDHDAALRQFDDRAGGRAPQQSEP